MAIPTEAITLAGPDKQGLFKVVKAKNTSLLYPGQLVTVECYENHLLPLARRHSGSRKYDFSLIEPKYETVMRHGKMECAGYFAVHDTDAIVKGHADLFGKR